MCTHLSPPTVREPKPQDPMQLRSWSGCSSFSETLSFQSDELGRYDSSHAYGNWGCKLRAPARSCTFPRWRCCETSQSLPQAVRVFHLRRRLRRSSSCARDFQRKSHWPPETLCGDRRPGCRRYPCPTYYSAASRRSSVRYLCTARSALYSQSVTPPVARNGFSLLQRSKKHLVFLPGNQFLSQGIPS
jgi:hypothetical protein